MIKRIVRLQKGIRDEDEGLVRLHRFGASGKAHLAPVFHNNFQSQTLCGKAHTLDPARPYDHLMPASAVPHMSDVCPKCAAALPGFLPTARGHMRMEALGEPRLAEILESYDDYRGKTKAHNLIQLARKGGMSRYDIRRLEGDEPEPITAFNPDTPERHLGNVRKLTGPETNPERLAQHRLTLVGEMGGRLREEYRRVLPKLTELHQRLEKEDPEADKELLAADGNFHGFSVENYPPDPDNHRFMPLIRHARRVDPTAFPPEMLRRAGLHHLEDID